MTPLAPLDGLTVVDFTHAVAGPLAAMVLADFGARVIKVEPPSGDGARALSRPDGTSYLGLFETFNRGKESVVLDLETPAGRAAAHDLVDRADVLVQSFRPGVMQRHGLGATEARTRNPGLVYASVSGYGGSDPRGGVDMALQGETGWMSVTGEPDGPPTKVGALPIDVATGHVLAQAVLAALLRRARTGVGDEVEVALYDVGCHLHAHDFTEYLMAGRVTKRTGNHPGLTAPSGLYETADGAIVLAAYMPKHWEMALAVLGDDELRTDPRFATLASRIEHRAELVAELQRVMRGRPTAEWVRLFDDARLTAGQVLDTGQVAESAQFARNGMELRVTSETGRTARTIRHPARFGAFVPAASSPAPLLDEHGDRFAGVRA